MNNVKKRIEVGTTVDVHWESLASEFRCEVLHLPCDVGDSWRLKREDGTIIQVGYFAKMVESCILKY